MGKSCTAIVRFELVFADLTEFMETLKSVEPVLLRQEGLMDSTRLIRDDRGEVVNVLCWRDRSCHERCQTNPDVLQAGAGLLGMIESGAVRMSVGVYEELEASAPID